MSGYLEMVFAECHSPIERAMLEAFLRVGWTFDVCPLPVEMGIRLSNGAFSHGSLDDICLTVHHAIVCDDLAYELDFSICWDVCWPKREMYRLALDVEVDGHQFHERTKEQASRDRSRDRALAANGWVIFRFTGAEVFADPDRCVGDIHRAVWSLRDRWLHGVLILPTEERKRALAERCATKRHGDRKP
jgi:hypothetical protein